MNKDVLVDERLEFAQTLSSGWYTDPAVLQQEKEKIFARTWQLVGRAEQVAEAGDYFTASVVDEPLIIVRDREGMLRAFSNVCRHRAGPVAEGSGNRKNFQCVYHGWTYSMDGLLVATPEFGGVQCFDKSENSLPQFQVEEWNNLIFVNLDSNCDSLASVLEDLPARIANRDLAGMKLAARKDWFIDCNWKVYVDNYLEGYHIPIAHPSLSRELDYSQYRTETRKYYSIQHSPLKSETATRLIRDERSSEVAAQYFWIFPNLMLNVYADNYSTNLILPLGADRTLTVFEWYFANPELDETKEAIRRTVEFSDEIQVEDINLCEAVQRGLRSRTYTAGRYSVKRENGVHHFHTLLGEFFARS
jgi:choline monooxygenase